MRLGSAPEHNRFIKRIAGVRVGVMVTVKGLIHYVGPRLARPWSMPKNLMLRDNGGLPRTFRKALLKSQEAFTVNLVLPGYPELHCNFARCGEAAGVAHWWRGDVTEALTAYLPGLDEADEDIVEVALASKPYPISLHLWHGVLKAERPIYANFLLTRAAAEDRLLATAADALAYSFFSVLGVT